MRACKHGHVDGVMHTPCPRCHIEGLEREIADLRHMLEVVKATTGCPSVTEAMVKYTQLAKAGERRLEKPARVGNTIFGAGVPERLVIGRAQREYNYTTKEEKP